MEHKMNKVENVEIVTGRGHRRKDNSALNDDGTQ